MTNNQKDAFLESLEEQLKELAIGAELPKFDNLAGYIGTEIPILGLRSPVINQVFTAGFPFSEETVTKQLDIWDYFWKHTQCFEVMSLCLIFVRKRHKKLDAAHLFQVLKGWIFRIDNWAHSDELSYSFATLIDRLPHDILSLLQEWNRSDNPWERRQSLIIPIRINRPADKQWPFKQLIRLVETLVDDRDYFVQKAVGWSLRDLARQYPEDIMAWMQGNHVRLTSVAFATASERVAPQVKAEWKEQRKKHRSA
jgi:3-methyladenine DNA glycosylase AlkD